MPLRNHTKRNVICKATEKTEKFSSIIDQIERGLRQSRSLDEKLLK